KYQTFQKINTPQSQRTRNASATMTEIIRHYIPSDKGAVIPSDKGAVIPEIEVDGASPISIASTTAVKRKSTFRPDRIASPPPQAPSFKKSSELVEKNGITKEISEHNTVEEYADGAGTCG
ncbi:UNVERIFIED_CONTAM: hypothetical protein HDU68_004007, partial [Siphonaria sp. JEL0065]